jgi:hypothetical protein
MASEREDRRFIAVDETCVHVNGVNYWVYSALDVDRNELKLKFVMVEFVKMIMSYVTSFSVILNVRVEAFTAYLNHSTS